MNFEPLRNDLAEELRDHIEMISSTEPSFGHASALLKHGRFFRPRQRKIDWLRLGPKRACFNNATAYAVARNDVFYAEGYAIEPGLPFPVQHAWLVDAAGEVVDPTWDDTHEHVYFGIAFKRSFVAETLARNNSEPGILVNLHLLRRQSRALEAVEEAIIQGSVQSFDLTATWHR